MIAFTIGSLCIIVAIIIHAINRVTDALNRIADAIHQQTDSRRGTRL
jgi:hypothetical protein